MKRYKMPDGTTRQFADGLAPACAVLIEAPKAAKPEAKAADPEPETKAVQPENKAAAPKKNKKGSKK